MSNTLFFVVMSALLLLSVAIVIWDIMIYRIRWRKRPHCPRCLYNLSDKYSANELDGEQALLAPTGQASSGFQAFSCNECGLTITKSAQLFRWRRKVWLTLLHYALICLLLCPHALAIKLILDHKSESRIIASQQVHRYERYHDSQSKFLLWHISELPPFLYLYAERVKGVSLGHNHEVDYKQLSQLQHLKSFSISMIAPEVHQLGDIHLLGQVDKLWLERTHVSSLDSIKRVDPVDLRFWFSSFDTADFSSLHQCQRLIHLDLLLDKRTPIYIKPGKTVPILRTAQFLDCQFQETHPFQGWHQLQKLYFSTCQFSQKDPFTPLKRLRQLSIISCSKIDLKSLQGMSALEELHIENTPTENIDALGNLSSLRILKIIQKYADDFSWLKGMKNLTRLHLRNTSIRSLDSLINIKTLQFLELDKRWANMPELESLRKARPDLTIELI